MTALMLANPIASALLAAFGALALLTLVRIAWGRIKFTVGDHSEREVEQEGDVTVRIFQHGRSKRPYPGDGVDAGV